MIFYVGLTTYMSAWDAYLSYTKALVLFNDKCVNLATIYDNKMWSKTMKWK